MSELLIGQVAERTALSAHTLRFYEREGLLVGPVRRNARGQRVYGEDDLDWLTVCTVLRAAGMPIPQLRRYADLVRQGEGNETGRLELLRAQRRHIEAQRAALDRCLDLIAFKVGFYEDVLDAQSDAARGRASSR